MTSDFIKDGYLTLIFCVAIPIIGWIFSFIYYLHTKRININPSRLTNNNQPLNSGISNDQLNSVWEIYNLIYKGAHSFLYAEYFFIAIFIIAFGATLFVVLGLTDKWKNSIFTVISFVVGALTSVLSGYIGMKIGVFANARTAVKCQENLADGFRTSFKAAVVMGFCLCSFGVFNLYVLILLVKLGYGNAFKDADDTKALFEAIAGFGLGGSSIALFGRVGGGIYTKAADVGADLVGKCEFNIPEDDKRNPATIADNVGDNVGDIAGMGSDLFGSFAESSCAALVIAAQTSSIMNTNKPSEIWQHWGYVSFPLIVSASGIIASLITSFFATHLFSPKTINSIEPTLKKQLLISTIIETCFMFLLSMIIFPTTSVFLKSNTTDAHGVTVSDVYDVKNWHIFICLASGLWCGLAVGYITEYYTSNRFTPVKELAENCKTGAATNIIIGLALGYKSVVIPIICMAIATFVGHSLAGFYGVALNAIGILSTLSIGLTIDAFGPICDNAGGIAEMCELGDATRDRTDALDAAGNTTAAIGKGFAIGSAAFVSLALFSGYMTLLQSRANADKSETADFNSVDMLQPYPFAGLLIGAMIPYWFSAMTMAAVGRAAFAMVREVRQQFEEEPLILSGEKEPDYNSCIMISTNASLREMVPPGLLVMGSPIIVGFLFGCQALAGMLLGALVSGVQMAISASNTGGAWDNAKKYIEQGKLGEEHAKGTETHKAAVVGDTVGDPLKDTSGPAINIVMKLMAVESLVLSRAFYIKHDGLFGYIGSKI